MAEVWVATDLQLSRQVAVKLLKPTLAHDPVVAERFRREAIAVAQLSHPNIVAVYDAIEESGRQAVVMQLVSGKSLRQLLDDQKRLSPDLTMHIGACVAAALDAAHQAGMVHRDVKPGNILITPDGRVLLTDFGIAKGLEPSADDDLTNDNIMMGTAKYLSPEQVRGRRLDGRADLYSLGLVLYECLAGRVPFLGQNDADTALARLQRDPTDITRLRPTLPRGLPELIHRLLARRPDQRYASGAAVRAAIAEIQSRPPEPALGSEYTLSAPRVVNPTPRSGSRTAADAGSASPVGPSGRPAQAVGGYQPVRTGTRADRDRTPTGAHRVRQQPNRRYQQRRGPSLLLVSALLLTAAVLVAVLITQLGDDDAAGFVAPTTVDPATVVTTPAPTVPLVGTSIASVTAFDPDGDGEENDDQASAVVDGDPSTGWNTVCYSSEYLGGKGGVGLVATFDAPAAGTFTVDIASAPWIVEVYASTAETAPSSIGDWGESVASANATKAKTLEVPLLTPARHVLVLMRQLGASESCSGDNPYRGTITELRFAATG
jgi:serine/threonine protein kinase